MTFSSARLLILVVSLAASANSEYYSYDYKNFDEVFTNAFTKTTYDTIDQDKYNITAPVNARNEGGAVMLGINDSQCDSHRFSGQFTVTIISTHWCNGDGGKLTYLFPDCGYTEISLCASDSERGWRYNEKHTMPCSSMSPVSYDFHCYINFRCKYMTYIDIDML